MDKLSFWQIFSDGEMLSWMRVAGTLIILCASYGFIYSIMTHWNEGVMASSLLIGSVLALKAYQTKKELENSK